MSKLKVEKSKLVLGTVQLGMKYGVNNSTGQPSLEEAFKILDTAYTGGIDTLDTAYAYGNSEEVIGEWLAARKLTSKIKIISKMRPHCLNDYPDGAKAEDIVREEIKKSLRRLRIEKLDGYLFHSPYYIYLQHAVTGLRQAKAEGLVDNIGVSIYNEAEALQAVELAVDYIQVPYNVFDRRIEGTGFFDLAQENKVAVFARAPFLQGLLVMPPDNLPDHLTHARPHLEKFVAISEKWQIPRATLALFFSYLHPANSHVVFGVETVEQIKSDLSVLANPPAKIREAVAEVRREFQDMAQSIVLSSLWGKLKPNKQA